MTFAEPACASRAWWGRIDEAGEFHPSRAARATEGLPEKIAAAVTALAASLRDPAPYEVLNGVHATQLQVGDIVTGLPSNGLMAWRVMDIVANPDRASVNFHWLRLFGEQGGFASGYTGGIQSPVYRGPGAEAAIRAQVDAPRQPRRRRTWTPVDPATLVFDRPVRPSAANERDGWLD